ncbi:UbiA family prenyltransferase [Isosphaeraceae bacterium EP7]
MRRLKPYLQLVRLPNVFTAAADSVAGWLLAGGSPRNVVGWAPLALASMTIYAAGIAWNDYFDYEIDLIERPGRPLPSGRISRRFAGLLAAGLAFVGLASASLAGPGPAAVALALVGCILAYNVGLKRTPLGPWAMGSCRGLDVLLGLVGASGLAFGGNGGLLVVVALVAYIAGVTYISRSEVVEGPAQGTSLGLGLQVAAIAGLLVAAFRPSLFSNPSLNRPLIPVEGLLILVLVAWSIVWAGAGALREQTGLSRRKAVKTGVLALVWLHVGVVAAVRGVPEALLVAAWWPPAFLLGRWIYST